MSNTPIDVQEPDSLINLLNKQAADEKKAAKKQETEARQTAAKEAHKTKVLCAKRRNWFAGLLHWITHICGLLCIAYTLRDFGCPDALWCPVVAAAALAIVFWMPGIVKGFPRKK